MRKQTASLPLVDPLAWSTAGASGPDVGTFRRTVHDGRIALVEDSSRDVRSPLGAGWSPEDQVVFPYIGAFEWRVGGERRLIDANSTLFVAAGQEFRETHPHRGLGHGSVIITPAEDLLQEIGVCKPQAAFPAVTKPMTDAARVVVHRLLFAVPSDLAKEEMALWLVAATAGRAGRERDIPNRRIIERAKEVLHERGYEPLSLACVARLVGVSPIYLTQTFTRSEGMPLYRYQMRLRLSRALFELPRRESLIELALDLGFSSHSHFTSTFRSVFGLTPSEFRAQCLDGGYAAPARRKAA
jgi:AraC family transcriptional regulator